MAQIIQMGGERAQAHLFAGPIRVGRDKGLTITLDDPKCSREHTFFYVTEENGKRVYWVRDLGSRNGTLLNNQKLTAPAKLADGDVVRVGSTDFTFRLDPAEIPSKPVRKPIRSDPVAVPRSSASGALGRILLLIVLFAAATVATKYLATRYIDSLWM